LAETNQVASKEAAEIAGPEATRGGTCYTPRVDIYETADEVVLMCDLPGARPQDLNVEFVKGELSLSGKVQPRQAPAEYDRQEYGVGDFYRSFAISPEIDAGKISAESRDGVLTVHLPKPEKAKPKKIAVKTG
jgi:HSP20 family molecular chaperone IbpA